MATEKTTTKVTEDELLKSLTMLEKAAKNEEPEPDAEDDAEEEVETEAPKKTASRSVADGASEGLKKALEVSDVLSEVVGLIGSHVDSALETMAKSIKASADRDLAFAKIMGAVVERLDQVGVKLDSFGANPTSAMTKTITATKTEILEKSAKAGVGDQDPNLSPMQKAVRTKGQILAGLEILTKAAAINDRGKYVGAAIKFETTGQITDVMLAEARQALPNRKAA